MSRGAVAWREAQRSPPLRSSAQAQRWALGCRRPAFLACSPRLAGAALWGLWTGLKHSGAPDGRHLTTAIAILVI